MQLLQQKRAATEHRKRKAQSDAALLEDYYTTLRQMRLARRAFEQAKDPEIISACVYEINALQERYVYLLRRLREEKVTAMRVLR